jgi:hypothetical protein
VAPVLGLLAGLSKNQSYDKSIFFFVGKGLRPTVETKVNPEGIAAFKGSCFFIFPATSTAPLLRIKIFSEVCKNQNLVHGVFFFVLKITLVSTEPKKKKSPEVL